MWIHICVYIYICAYMYILIHIHVPIQREIYILHTYVIERLRDNAYTGDHIYVYIYIYIDTCAPLPPIPAPWPTAGCSTSAPSPAPRLRRFRFRRGVPRGRRGRRAPAPERPRGAARGFGPPGDEADPFQALCDWRSGRSGRSTSDPKEAKHRGQMKSHYLPVR